MLVALSFFYADLYRHKFKGEELAAEVGDRGERRSVSQRRVVAYLNKYMGKEYGTVGYNQRRFYRTHNVIGKTKRLENMSAAQQLRQLGMSYSVRNDESASEKFEIDMDENSPFYVYKQDSKRIYLRMKRAEVPDGEKMAMLLEDGKRLKFIPEAEAEKLVADGVAEPMEASPQYKVYRMISPKF